jgi:uncharacterized protein (TIGR02271 family)
VTALRMATKRKASDFLLEPIQFNRGAHHWAPEEKFMTGLITRENEMREPPEGRPARTDQVGELELKEERLRVDKQREQVGTVRVSKRVQEHTETRQVPVREERLIIEHRPGGGTVSVGGRQLFEGETVEIPVMRDRVVVTKEPLLVEEVSIRKEVYEHAEQGQATLRREELEVDTAPQAPRVGPSRHFGRGRRSHFQPTGGPLVHRTTVRKPLAKLALAGIASFAAGRIFKRH